MIDATPDRKARAIRFKAEILNRINGLARRHGGAGVSADTRTDSGRTATDRAGQRGTAEDGGQGDGPDDGNESVDLLVSGPAGRCATGPGRCARGPAGQHWRLLSPSWIRHDPLFLADACRCP